MKRGRYLKLSLVKVFFHYKQCDFWRRRGLKRPLDIGFSLTAAESIPGASLQVQSAEAACIVEQYLIEFGCTRFIKEDKMHSVNSSVVLKHLGY